MSRSQKDQPTDTPVFAGTPDQWWEQATPITEAEAADRELGGWYIISAGTSRAPDSSFRVSTPSRSSNDQRKSALRKEVEKGTLKPDDISAKVRRLIEPKAEPPEWASAELVIADLHAGSDQRGAWRRTHQGWRLLSDGRVMVLDRFMGLLNPRVANVIEQPSA